MQSLIQKKYLIIRYLLQSCCPPTPAWKVAKILAPSLYPVCVLSSSENLGSLTICPGLTYVLQHLQMRHKPSGNPRPVHYSSLWGSCMCASSTLFKDMVSLTFFRMNNANSRYIIHTINVILSKHDVSTDSLCHQLVHVQQEWYTPECLGLPIPCLGVLIIPNPAGYTT